MAQVRSNDIRYQTFVSSTFGDLREERDAVTRQILAMERCIPAGMELFGASPRPSWTVITSVLDATDYLVLIVGSRYGSIKPGGRISFTHAEYRYAVASGVPVLAFLPHSDRKLREDQRETNVKAQASLTRFVKEVETSGVQVDYWRDSQDLAHRVSSALWKAFESTPRPGWRRGPFTPPNDSEEQAAAAPLVPSPTFSGLLLRVIASREAERHTLRDAAGVLVVVEPVSEIAGAGQIATSVQRVSELLTTARDESGERLAQWSARLGHRDLPLAPKQVGHGSAMAVAGAAAQEVPWHPHSRPVTATCEVAVTDTGGIRIYSEPFGFRSGIAGSYEPALDLAVPALIVHRALQLLVILSKKANFEGDWRLLVRTLNASNLPALTSEGVTAERLGKDYDESLRCSLVMARTAPRGVAEQLLRNLFRQFPGTASQYSALIEAEGE